MNLKTKIRLHVARISELIKSSEFKRKLKEDEELNRYENMKMISGEDLARQGKLNFKKLK